MDNVSKEVHLFASLIERCIRREEKARRELYDLFSKAMYQICLRYAKDKDQAEDIFQEAFIKVFENLNKVSDPKALAGWIRTTFVHTAIDYARKHSKGHNTDLDSLIKQPGSNDFIVEGIMAEDIMKMVQKLPTKPRMVFNLYVMEGFNHREIAEMMEMSEGTSKSLLFDARKLLKEALAKEEAKRMKIVV